MALTVFKVTFPEASVSYNFLAILTLCFRFLTLILSNKIVLNFRPNIDLSCLIVSTSTLIFFPFLLLIAFKTKPSFSTDKINKLRVDLIKEELEELTEAMNNKDLLEVADALTDILYVTYGAGHAFGIDLDKCFDEVQNSNMSKLDENGKPIYNESGKVMKGPNYFKPDLSKFIN